MADFKERLLFAMNLRQIKPVDLANQTGLSKARISQYMNGTYIPKSKGILVLAQALSVRETWLMGLDVPMDIQLLDNIHEKTLNPKETTLVHNYRKLDDIDKSKVEERIDTLLDSDKYKPFEILPIAARDGTKKPQTTRDNKAERDAALEKQLPHLVTPADELPDV